MTQGVVHRRTKICPWHMVQMPGVMGRKQSISQKC